jgi:hypothetical protein
MNQSSEDQLLEHMFGSFGGDDRDRHASDDMYGGWMRFGEVCVNRITGEVQVPDGAGLSEMSLMFWRSVREQSSSNVLPMRRVGS